MPNRQPNHPPRPVHLVYLISFILSLIILGIGIYLTATHREMALLATGCICLIATLVSWPIATNLCRSTDSASHELRQAMEPVHERFQQLSVMLNLISEQQLLSDRAKSVAFREKDREALRRAIQEEMGRGDFEAASSLADEMEKIFGYKQEADRLRQEINERRTEGLRKALAESTVVIDRAIRSERWQDAHREAEKLAAQYPNSDQIKNIPNEINARRDQHKKQLIQSLDEAVARKDTDGGVEILKKLDAYLTPAEAESMQETARGIFKQKLENLRTQFSMAVKEGNWPDAIRIGDMIVRDFPNTQMAREVREAMDGLHQRANESTPVPATA